MKLITLRKFIKNRLIQLPVSVKKYSLKNAIIISSESRSGSTWLMEVLGEIPNSVVNWEPLHPNKGVVPKHYKFGSRPFIKPTNDSKTLIDFFENVLTLKSYSSWTVKFISFNKVFSSKYVVTKFVRANSLLPWFTRNLNLEHKPILLLRHPITTCASQLKTFNKVTGASLSQPYSEQEIFMPPDCINNERYIENQAYINSLLTPLERKIALWCVNNMDVIKHEDTERWITVYYEDLVLNPEEELSTLLKNLDLPFTLKNFKNIDFKKPSNSNALKSYSSDINIQLESFLSDFEDEYLKKIQNIFDYYGLEDYKASSAYPIKLKTKG